MDARPPRSFFDRPAEAVAPELLGMVLCRRLPSQEVLRARLVETEAYGPDDPASHSFPGPSGRNASMFGEPGRLYVYFVYGMHFCANVVTGPPGVGSAVLLRAAEPLQGHATMAEHRGRDGMRDLCRGPARLAQAMALDRALDGSDLLARATPIWLERGVPLPDASIDRSTRVGIRRAKATPWRFSEKASPWVSLVRWRPAARSAPPA